MLVYANHGNTIVAFDSEQEQIVWEADLEATILGVVNASPYDWGADSPAVIDVVQYRDGSGLAILAEFVFGLGTMVGLVKLGSHAGGDDWACELQASSSYSLAGSSPTMAADGTLYIPTNGDMTVVGPDGTLLHEPGNSSVPDFPVSFNTCQTAA